MKTIHSLSVQDLERLESVCVQYENAQKEDRDIERLVQGLLGPVRSQFIQELVALDLELRIEQGELPLESDYDFSDKTDAEDARQAFLAFSRAGNQQSDALLRDCLPSLPDRYEQLEEIGRGGIGSVWRVQDMRSQRTLAVKTLRNKFRNDRQANIRLEREALLTGSLQHPGIPPVHDFGEMSDGSVYFAMKLIDGQTLAEILQQSVDNAERQTKCLNIFEHVSQALAYVHTQGVIHRDLKPQNIMVGRFGEVQIMDWGMAKRLDEETPTRSEVTERKLDADQKKETVMSSRDSSIELEPGLTQAGDILGTPSYMSPEQARGEIGELNARSDVFGLGAILYEILTGNRLYDEESSANVLGKAATGDLSGSLQLLDDCDADAALVRICQRCLAVDASDRPANAGVVAKEIAQHFANTQQRVKAAEMELHEAEVRANEEIKRRKTFSRMMMAVVGVFALGLAGVIWQWTVAKENEAEAIKSAKGFEDVLLVVTDAFASVDPTQGSNAQMTAKQVLQNARSSLEESELDQEGRALLLTTLAKSFYGLGDYEVSYVLARQSLDIRERIDPNSLETWESMGDIANAGRRSGRINEGIEIMLESISQQEAILGPDDPLTMKSRERLGFLYVGAGEYAKGIELVESALDFNKKTHGQNHIDTLTSQVNLGLIYRLAGRYEDSIEMLVGTVGLARDEQGADHPLTLNALGNLAASYAMAGNHEKGLEMFEQLFEARKAKQGPDHPETLNTMGNIAVTLMKLKRYGEALELQQKALEIRKRRMGPKHPWTLAGMTNVALALVADGQNEKAAGMLAEALELRLDVLGEDHPDTLSSMLYLGDSHLRFDQYDEAIELYQTATSKSEAVLGPEHPFTIKANKALASALTARDRATTSGGADSGTDND